MIVTAKVPATTWAWIEGANYCQVANVFGKYSIQIYSPAIRTAPTRKLMAVVNEYDYCSNCTFKIDHFHYLNALLLLNTITLVV